MIILVELGGDSSTNIEMWNNWGAVKALVEVGWARAQMADPDLTIPLEDYRVGEEQIRENAVIDDIDFAPDPVEPVTHADG
jgi:hypothetical protein